MSINSPVISKPKNVFHDIPLWIALLITTVVHLLLIVGLQIKMPKTEKQLRFLEITIVRKPPPPIQEKPAPAIAKPPITPAAEPVQKPPAAGKKTDQTVKPPHADFPETAKPKKVRKNRHPVAPIATAPKVVESPDVSVAEQAPPAIPEAKAEPKAKVEAVAPDVSEPVIKPDAIVPEPVPEPKAEANPVPSDAYQPIGSRPRETEPEVVPADAAVAPPEPETIDKPIDLPAKASKKSGKKPSKKARRKNVASADNAPPPLSLDNLAEQIAQVGEKFGTQPEPTISGESRVKKLNSVRAHKFSARQYILDWQHKVERIGNLNFPEVARQKDFSAKLVMEVGINGDGSIHSMTIKKSSGTPALDEAAKGIVKMGEPYAALPKDLLQELDVLVIQRTWLFSDESGMTGR